MFRLVLFTAVIGCALAAPAPYDNPLKTGVVQEISKYQATAHNKPTPAVEVTRTEEKAQPQVQPAVVSHKSIEGPTPVPVAVKAETETHVNKRNAHHTPEHSEESKEKKQEGAKVQPGDFVRTPENDKKTQTTAAPFAKSAPVDVKTPAEHKETAESCGSSCTKDHHHHHKRGATTNPSESEINAKLPVIPAVHVAKVAEQQKEAKKPEEKHEVKREEATTAKPSHLTPTAFHTSFAHTWTRPQANPAVATHKEEEKTPAASENKPVIATIDPFKPIKEEKEPSSTTAASVPGHRVRRGLDETEEQDQPKEPKPTRAWWRSLDLNKNEKSAQETKEKEEKEKQKRETNEKISTERKPSGGSPVTSTEKARSAAEEATEPEHPRKDLIRPKPVAEILGHRQASIQAVTKKDDSSEEEEKKEKADEKPKSADQEKKKEEKKN